jgi:hypothetical protein
MIERLSVSFASVVKGERESFSKVHEHTRGDEETSAAHGKDRKPKVCS